MAEITYKRGDGRFRREQIKTDWELMIISARQRNNISLAKLIEAVGVSRQWWYKWRRGECMLSDEHKQKLVKLAGFPV